MGRTLYNINQNQFKKKEFRPHELSKKAFEYYSSESCIDYFELEETNKTTYWFIDCGTAEEIGTLSEVNAYFEAMQEEFEEEEN